MVTATVDAAVARPAPKVRQLLRALHRGAASIPLAQALDELEAIERFATLLERGEEHARSVGGDRRDVAAFILGQMRSNQTMSLTKQEVCDVYEAELAKGKTAAEALQGARTEIHAMLLAKHSPPERHPSHDDEQHHHAHAHHSADKWEEADRLLHMHGVGPEPKGHAGPAREIASIGGRAVATGKKA